MTDAHEWLVERAKNNNLCITRQGANPPGPVILTYSMEGEDLDVLYDIRDELGFGTVYSGLGKRLGGNHGTWIAYDEEAILVMIDLMPYLKAAPKCREVTVRICWAANSLCEWRREHPDWKRPK